MIRENDTALYEASDEDLDEDLDEGLDEFSGASCRNFPQILWELKTLHTLLSSIALPP